MPTSAPAGPPAAVPAPAVPVRARAGPVAAPAGPVPTPAGAAAPTVGPGGPADPGGPAGAGCAVSRHSSLQITWPAPAAGMASNAATKPPNSPPTQLPIDAATRIETSTSSGLIRTVLLITTRVSTWFSHCG